MNGVATDITQDEHKLWLSNAFALETSSVADLFDLSVTKVQLAQNLGRSIPTAKPMSSALRARANAALHSFYDATSMEIFLEGQNMNVIRDYNLAWIKIC